MIESNNLSYQLGSLWNDTCMNRSVNKIKSNSEGFLHRSDAMKLGIVRTHDGAVVANQLITRVTEIPEQLIV